MEHKSFKVNIEIDHVVFESVDWELYFAKVYLVINLGNLVIFHRVIEKHGVALKVWTALVAVRLMCS